MDEKTGFIKILSFMPNRQERRKFFKLNKKKIGEAWQTINELVVKQQPFINLKKQKKK